MTFDDCETMHQDPATLLDQALARLEKGERLHSVLADHPAQADELSSLLATVRKLKRLKSVPPPPKPQERLTAFLNQAKAIQLAPPPRPSPWRRLKTRLAFGGLAVWLLLGLLGSAIV